MKIESDEEKDKDIPYYRENKHYYDLIKSLSWEFYYGQLILNFEGGKIVHCKKNESIKL